MKDAGERVKRIYDEWGHGNFRAGTESYDPNVTLVIRPDLPDAGAYTGTAAIERYMRNLLDPWEKLMIRAEEIHEAGDTVVARVVQRGIGSSSGADVEQPYYQLWTFRGEDVIRIESITDADEAFAAAGLTR